MTALATVLFGIGLFGPVVLVVVGLVMALAADRRR